MSLPKLFLIPIAIIVLCQVFKFIREGFIKGKWDLGVLNHYGGMPSSHTALVTSLTTLVYLDQGLSSVAFAISLIFSLLIIKDSIGLRRYLGYHGRVLNMLIKDLPDEEEYKYPRHLTERLGHTPFEAFIGGTVGILLALLLNQIIPATLHF